MLKPLRHPTVFVLLTLCLTAWLAGWTRAATETYFNFVGTHYVFMPVYRAIGLVSDLPEHKSTRGLRNSQVFIGESWHTRDRSGEITVARNAGGRPVVVEGGLMAILRDPQQPYSQATIVRRAHVEFCAFGLLTPWVTLDHGVYVATSTAGYPGMHDQTAIDTAVRSGLLPPLVTRSIDWPNIAHDTALAITLLAWVYTVFAIPTWKLWRNLTPAQRRRNRHACPNCSYDRSATPDKPCPECGHASS